MKRVAMIETNSASNYE